MEREVCYLITAMVYFKLSISKIFVLYAGGVSFFEEVISYRSAGNICSILSRRRFMYLSLIE